MKGHGKELGIFIACDEADLLRQAQESTERFAAKKQLGIFDGVPMAIKDEVKMVGYPTTAGTSFLGAEPETEDAETVGRLRRAGAMLIGKANMHEVGLGVTGINPHYGPARNPYDPSRITGGSSSGSAAAVAAGFGPVSLGADGGGSIRIPAGLCGMVGLKATYGRISEYGAIPLCWSVGHLGPIGVTAGDVAAAYAIMAGPDPRDRRSLLQPPLHLHDVGNQDLKGVRLGICTAWFEDAQAEVVAACRTLVGQLVDAGAEVREVDVPDIELVKAAHLVIIISEMIAFNSKFGREHRHDFGLDVRVNFALGGDLTSSDYVHALRHRQSFTHQMLKLMKDVDVIVTPTTGTTAPPIPEHALPDGESDIAMLEEISRFAAMGNLTGFPAIGVPCGYDKSTLPISCQFLGRPWEEHLLLRLAHLADGLVSRRQPKRYASLLDDGPAAG
ncbi:MAG: amidase [Proteobacteria bacterium]|nr:amidase [Pseudomonadota bacterium]